MADFDTCIVPLQQEQVQGHPYNITAANNAHLFTHQGLLLLEFRQGVGLNLWAVAKGRQNQLLNGQRGARNKVRVVVLQRQAPDIVRAHAVDVFLRRNEAEHFLFVDVLGQRQLNHYSRDAGVIIQRQNMLYDFLLSHLLRVL